MPKLYRIVNDTFGKYRVETCTRSDGPNRESPWKPQGNTYDTFADARQAVRNAAIRDKNERDFAPGQWIFSEPQALGIARVDPDRIDL